MTDTTTQALTINNSTDEFLICLAEQGATADVRRDALDELNYRGIFLCSSTGWYRR